MFRSSMPRRTLPAPAARLLRAIPRPTALALAAAVTAAGLAGGVAAAGPALAADSPAPVCVAGATGGTCTVTLPYTHQQVTWDVPAGVSSANVTLFGGSGGSGGSSAFGYVNGAAGGAGAEVTGTVDLAGVGSLTVTVGQAGGDAPIGVGGYGGPGTIAPDGGTSGAGGGYGGGGGGATTVSDSSGPLLVAGGGGGGGFAVEGSNLYGAGGAGGNAGSNGQPGANVTADGATLDGGGGGYAPVGSHQGGAGGIAGQVMGPSTCSGGTSPGAAGDPGSQEGQGAVGTGQDDDLAGGGGGGGVYGGGQGGRGAFDGCRDYAGFGGGGGGSSLGSVVPDPTLPADADGNGQATITYTAPVITGLTPDRGPSFGFTPVLITGAGLACPAGDRSCQVTVTFGGRRALVVLDRPTKIWVLSPPGSGTVPVTVTVSGVSSQATPATFTYQRFL
jgi:hypothetical protein